MNADTNRILIVDDNEMNRDVLSRRLQRKGFVTAEADGGQRALEMLAENPYDMVLLDIMMPDIDGLEVLKRLRQHYSQAELPVIMVTAKTESDNVHEALSLGANDYVTKPIDIKVALARINTHLALKKHTETIAEMARREVEDSAERISAILSNTEEGVVTLTMEGVIESINPAAETIFQCEGTSLVEKPIDELLDGEALMIIKELLNAESVSEDNLKRHFPMETQARRINDTVFPAEIDLAQMHVAGKRMFTCIFRDISEKKQADETIRRLALTDSLTGLDNRAQFHSRLTQVMQSTRRQGCKMAVLFMDLDKFKEVNDTFGHGVGDELLCAVAKRVKSCVRGEDVVARLGGDEFAVVLAGIHDELNIQKPVQKILSSLKETITIDGYEHRAQASIGISVFPDDGTDADELLRKADVALYQSKTSGRGHSRFYDSEMDAAAQNRKKLVDALRTDLDVDNAFRLFFQPQIHLGSGEMVGAEALIRWFHKDRGMVSPADFIPVAEESGLVMPLGAWVLQEACRLAHDWYLSEPEHDDWRMSVNVSSKQFSRPDFVSMVRSTLEQTEMNPDCLELEITESMVMSDIDAVVKKLKQLREMGVALSIDDFGTGYSSLSYLKKLPVNRLKIDRSFIKDIPYNEEDRAITRAVIRMASSLNMEVVAEGMETHSQRCFLEENGCDIAQGFLISRPMPEEDFCSWVCGDSNAEQALLKVGGVGMV